MSDTYGSVAKKQFLPPAFKMKKYESSIRNIQSGSDRPSKLHF